MWCVSSTATLSHQLETQSQTAETREETACDTTVRVTLMDILRCLK